MDITGLPLTFFNELFKYLQTIDQINFLEATTPGRNVKRKSTKDILNNNFISLCFDFK